MPPFHFGHFCGLNNWPKGQKKDRRGQAYARSTQGKFLETEAQREAVCASIAVTRRTKLSMMMFFVNGAAGSSSRTLRFAPWNHFMMFYTVRRSVASNANIRMDICA